MNIATGAISENDEEDFLMNCISLAKAARNKFYESRLTDKNIQLLETIPKTRKSTKKKIEKKEYDRLKKQLNFHVILTMRAWEISILKFLWAMDLNYMLLSYKNRFDPKPK